MEPEYPLIWQKIDYKRPTTRTFTTNAYFICNWEFKPQILPQIRLQKYLTYFCFNQQPHDDKNKCQIACSNCECHELSPLEYTSIYFLVKEDRFIHVKQTQKNTRTTIIQKGLKRPLNFLHIVKILFIFK